MKACPMFTSTIALFLIIFPLHVLSSETSMEQDILDKLFEPSRYDKRIRRLGVNGTGYGPTIIKVNMMVRSIEYIDDLNMEYGVQLTFRQEWTDERLVFDDLEGKMKYLTLTETDKLWMPDLFFKNEKKGHFHNIIHPNTYVRIFPDGRVLYSNRISLTLSCPMDLKLYPMDKQMCQLMVASYGHTVEDIVLLWKNMNPVQVTKNLHLPRFTLTMFLTDYCNSKTNTGEYSCLVMAMVFNREFSYYLCTIYIPSVMLVIVAWVTFWLDRNALSARVALVALTLYIMVWQTTGLNQTLPPVSYTKAIDVWTGMCITFVFFALMEVVMVNYISQWDMPSQPIKLEETDNAFAMKPAARAEEGFSKFLDWAMARKIDVISRIAYPLLFVLFNIVYWSTYLPGDEDTHENTSSEHRNTVRLT